MPESAKAKANPKFQAPNSNETQLKRVILEFGICFLEFFNRRCYALMFDRNEILGGAFHIAFRVVRMQVAVEPSLIIPKEKPYEEFV